MEVIFLPEISDFGSKLHKRYFLRHGKDRPCSFAHLVQHRECCKLVKNAHPSLKPAVSQKLICLLTVLTTTTAFAVSPAQRTTSSSSSLFPTSKSKPATAPMFATTSPRQLATRGGAVPGWAAYNEKLESNPLATKAMTSLIGWALGDYLAQTFIGGGGVFNFKRFARLSAFGFLYHGPSGHYFYNWLDKQIVGTGPVAVAKKVRVFVFTTIFIYTHSLTQPPTFLHYKGSLRPAYLVSDLHDGVLCLPWTRHWRLSSCHFCQDFG